MNINDLKIFQAVAEYGSFTKAAAVANTVQSNVTARVKYLEDFFRAKLLTRTTRRIELTDEGLQVLKAAKEMQLLIDKTISSVSKSNLPPSGIVKIGCIHSTAALRAPGILGNFTKRYPDMEFRLKTGTTSSLIKDVLSFKLDGAFVSGKVNNAALDIEPVFTEELSIISSSLNSTLEEALSHSNPVKLIVFSKGCAYRERLCEILNGKGIETYKFIEMDTLDGIINSVETGIGITLLPAELIRKNYSYRSLHTFSLPKRKAKCTTHFIKRKDFPMSDGYAMFLKSVKDGYSV
ncbi:hypothetical protein A9P82_07655 [Arachidicoccus ginsenosidimutans]|uniref:LysR family transcriptional regulator n=1 Tax=Arachidicoccus sp. BS20 TaxID=1850526 RepID=UPI0007F07A32|nr:LysR family transcriptional regulator [Arachidicoccus sp. BS20]ANI89176.1 hypothetical protein A9P82_07655 [Arachidicoccus sp. BS20]